MHRLYLTLAVAAAVALSGGPSATAAYDSSLPDAAELDYFLRTPMVGYWDCALQTAVCQHKQDPDRMVPRQLNYYKVTKNADGTYRMADVPAEGYHTDWTLDEANGRLVLTGSGAGMYLTKDDGSGTQLWIQTAESKYQKINNWQSAYTFRPIAEDYALQFARYANGTTYTLYTGTDFYAYPVSGRALCLDTDHSTQYQQDAAATDSYVDVRLDAIYAGGWQTSPKWDGAVHPKPLRMGQLNSQTWYGGGRVFFPMDFPYTEIGNVNVNDFQVRSRDLANKRITYAPIRRQNVSQGDKIYRQRTAPIDDQEWRYVTWQGGNEVSTYVGSGDDATGDIACDIDLYWLEFYDFEELNSGFQWDKDNHGMHLTVQADITPLAPYNVRTETYDADTHTTNPAVTKANADLNLHTIVSTTLVILDTKTECTLMAYGNDETGIYLGGYFTVEKGDDMVADWVSEFQKDFNLHIIFNGPTDYDDPLFDAEEDHKDGLTGSLDITSADYDLPSHDWSVETAWLSDPTLLVKSADGNLARATDRRIYFSKYITAAQLQELGVTRPQSMRRRAASSSEPNIGLFLQHNYRSIMKGGAEVSMATGTDNGYGSSFGGYTAVPADQTTTSIRDVAEDLQDPDATAPAQWYTLQGQRVTDPVPGNTYIRRQGSRATKVRL